MIIIFLSSFQGLRYPIRKSQVRRQRAISASTPFFCQDTVPWGRSRERPTSVHKLRPGDIDVVAAIGDSLVAGSGALEEFALGAFVEYRGVSWCAGKRISDTDWYILQTLPLLFSTLNNGLGLNGIRITIMYLLLIFVKSFVQES